MKMKVTKSKLNFSIDIIMFLVLAAIAGIGFMIKYVLVPGFRRTEIYAGNVELKFWGLDRHQWGSIHLMLSFLLLFLLLLHIVFHWKQIVGIYKNMVVNKVWRIVLSSAFVIISLILGILPLFLEPAVLEGETHHQHLSRNTEIVSPEVKTSHLRIESGEIANKAQISITNTKKEHSHKHREDNETQFIDVDGSMTLAEVAAKYDMSVDELASCIQIPSEYSNENLGRLKKQYGFQMSELRDYIELKTKEQ